jgi:hypothetical protein
MDGIAKVGDIIEWTFPNTDNFIGTNYEQYMGKIFQSEVAYVSIEDEFFESNEIDYGVFTEYGQDYIPHNQCKIIKII